MVIIAETHVSAGAVAHLFWMRSLTGWSPAEVGVAATVRSKSGGVHGTTSPMSLPASWMT
jgi:hypothetical protein